MNGKGVPERTYFHHSFAHFSCQHLGYTCIVKSHVSRSRLPCLSCIFDIDLFDIHRSLHFLQLSGCTQRHLGLPLYHLILFRRGQTTAESCVYLGLDLDPRSSI